MKRKNIMAVAILVTGMVMWRAGAMQEQGESLRSRMGNQAQQRVILETKDGRETPVDINKARLFGLINEQINRVIESEDTPVRYFDEFDISLGKPSLEEAIPLMGITKPTLDYLLGDLNAVFESYKTNDPADILKYSMIERSNKVEPTSGWSIRRLQLPIGMVEAMRRSLERLNAAYYLEMPELISRYALDVRYLLRDPASLALLNRGNHELLDLVSKEPAELQEIIREHLRKLPPHTIYMDWYRDMKLKTIEQEVLIELFGEYNIGRRSLFQVTPWIINTWHTLSDADKTILRKQYPDLVKDLDAQLNLGSVKRPVQRFISPSDQSSSSSNQ